jgi:hypothetical protein
MAGCPRLCKVHVLRDVASDCNGRFKRVSIEAGKGTMKNKNPSEGLAQSKNFPPPSSQQTPPIQIGSEQLSSSGI